MTTQNFLADKIFNEFDRLGVSTNQDSYSGLMCDGQSLLIEGEPDIIVVKIYDDSSSGLYNGKQVLEFLMGTTEANLTNNDTVNIWYLINEFEY